MSLGRTGTPGEYLQIEANTFNTRGQGFAAYVTNNAYDTVTVTSTMTPGVHVLQMQNMIVGTPITSVLGVWLNGTPQTLQRTPGGLGNGNVESLLPNRFRVGAGTGGADVSEVLVYDRPLTDVERLQVETYLRQRYGL